MNNTLEKMHSNINTRREKRVEFSSYIPSILWLISIYFVATWIAVGSLSSMQLRNVILDKYDSNFSTIQDILHQHQSLQESKNAWIAQLNMNVLKLERDLEDYTVYMRQFDGEGKRELASIASDLKVDFSSVERSSGPEEYCKGPSLTQKQQDACTRWREFQEKWQPYQDEVSAKKGRLEQSRTTLVAAIENPENNPYGVASKRFDDKTIRMINDLSYPIQFMDKILYSSLLIMPDQVLELILAISMGMLGSAITMTWTFLSDTETPHWRWYLMRPFVGALSAVVIFIFAKGGQMALTSGNGTDNLSPFFLSFLSIAAGLLSDRAFSQMSLVSGKVLGDMGTEKERWAVHLSKTIKENNINIEILLID